MQKEQLKFALFGNVYQERKSAAVQKLLAVLEAHGIAIAVESEFLAFLRDKLQICVPDCEVITGDSIGDVDYVVCMGGDGTFLGVASRIGNAQVPILGINTGRLGFLASFSSDDIEVAVADICKGRVCVERRSLLQVLCDDEPLQGYPFALNEVAILKHDISSMISIHTRINGEYLTTYQADGLIVGTPTGSTAYSLSVGGPIVVPNSHTMSLTPVAPHSLNMRPLVLCDDSEVELCVESRSHSFLVAMDGRSQSYRDGIHLRIRRAPYDVQVVVHPGESFFTTLRRKMMWGTDHRE